MSTFTLTDSIGTGGANRPEDVLALKERLVELGYDWLTADDTVDADLREAINLIQSIKLGRNTLQGDGCVDVPGPTYDWLRAGNAPRWQLMPEGSPDEGFVNVERADPSDNHDFGTDWMAETIRCAAIWYRDNYLASNVNAALLTINDVSLPHGGNTPDHEGHETGLACDLRLSRQDGTAPGSTTFSDNVYDQDGMRAMLQAIRHQPQVSRILFNDPLLIAEHLCAHADGHDNHAHFEIMPLEPIMTSRPENELLQQAIVFFGGNEVDPTGYLMTENGFQSYLDDTGIQHFSAGEMLSPNQLEAANGLGYSLFLPPHVWWPRGATLALLADKLRNMVGEPVKMRNWWRPCSYNEDEKVGGASESDHITAHAVDLDYRSSDSRRTAERGLREMYEQETWLELSLGLGYQTTHVGILSPKGQRIWTYSSYQP